MIYIAGGVVIVILALFALNRFLDGIRGGAGLDPEDLEEPSDFEAG